MEPRDPSGDGALSCDQLSQTLSSSTVEDDSAGEPACWAHLVCPRCGCVMTEGHTPGCKLGPAALR
jgi:hypothetical protein